MRRRARASSGPRARCSTMRANISPTMARATLGARSSSSGIFAVTDSERGLLEHRDQRRGRRPGGRLTVQALADQQPPHRLLLGSPGATATRPAAASRSAGVPPPRSGGPSVRNRSANPRSSITARKHVGLRREVVVQRGDVEVARAGQAAHRRAGHALLAHQAERRVEDPGSRRRRGVAHVAATAIRCSGVKTAGRWCDGEHERRVAPLAGRRRRPPGCRAAGRTAR